jgi:hypothetical protein
MLKAPWNKLTGRESDGFKPAKSDKELMENVKDRLAMLGSLQQPAGTVLRSIPGATVKFLPLAGTVVPTVFTDEQPPRPVGSITSDGQIVYVQPRKTNV